MNISINAGEYISTAYPEDITVVFSQTPQRTGKMIQVYFLSTDRKVGRFQMTPTEFAKIAKVGLDLLSANRIAV